MFQQLFVLRAHGCVWATQNNQMYGASSCVCTVRVEQKIKTKFRQNFHFLLYNIGFMYGFCYASTILGLH